MKLSKVLTSLVIMTSVALALTGCGSGSNANLNANPSASADDTATPDNKVYRIGAVQSMEHGALDAAYDGFVKALEDNGYVEGENITIDRQNAQGDTSNLSTIGDRYVNDKVDMILAITTDAAQAMAGKTTDIPIVATAVTSYSTAGLVKSEDEPGGNLTGTSDMNPVAAQIELIKDMLPDVKTIGLIYNSSEDNSMLQANLAKEEIANLGLEYTEVTVSNSSEVQQAMQSLVGKCDAVYIPTDNTLASAMATVHSVAGEAKLPTFCGESNMVLEGGLATMGINYYSLGYQTGMMAIEIMKGKNPGEMPIQFAESSDAITINAQVAEEIGYEIPEKYSEYVIDPRDEQ